jgi:hypothetical protein
MHSKKESTGSSLLHNGEVPDYISLIQPTQGRAQSRRVEIIITPHLQETPAIGKINDNPGPQSEDLDDLIPVKIGDRFRSPGGNHSD